VADVSVSFMMETAREAVAENVEDYPSHITAFFDSTWQKRGPTFLNGIISATSVNRGKILDTRTMSKSCFFVTPIQLPNMSVKITMNEQVVEWKVLVYTKFLIVLFIPDM
jgi:hypothetical protein